MNSELQGHAGMRTSTLEGRARGNKQAKGFLQSCAWHLGYVVGCVDSSPFYALGDPVLSLHPSSVPSSPSPVSSPTPLSPHSLSLSYGPCPHPPPLSLLCSSVRSPGLSSRASPLSSFSQRPPSCPCPLTCFADVCSQYRMTPKRTGGLICLGAWVALVPSQDSAHSGLVL